MSANRPDPQAQINADLKLAARQLSAGKPDEAANVCRKILARFPNHAQTHYVLAVSLNQSGQLEEAIAAYRDAIRLKPDFFEALTNLGTVLGGVGNLDAAIAAFGEASRLRPQVAEIQVNLSNAYRESWKIDAAIVAAERAITLKSSLPDAHLCLGAAMACLGQFDRAIAVYRQAIRLRPDYPAAHLNLALAELVTGNLARGWPEYEWRQRGHGILPPRNFKQPRWEGQPLDGKTILLYAEQGFGDAIHFVRYLPNVAESAGKILLECPEPLARLFRHLPGVDRVIATGQTLPAFDVQCALPSLPGVFKTTLDSIPAPIPYLSAKPDAAEQWRMKIEPSEGILQIGLVWSGSPDNRNDRNRSIPLQKFSPLGQIAGVQFHSLQIAPPPANAGISPRDWSPELKDFADTGALIANLDAVISVDTAPAHLAAAMGKTVWLLIPFPPDWRWLLGRSDSPWYPTMRLFRQTRPGDWEPVIADVAGALGEWKTRNQKSE